MNGFNGSSIKIIQALSPGSIGSTTPGSTGPSNFAGFEWATVIVSIGCAISATANRLAVDVERSSTSNGTFGKAGASFLAISAGSQCFVRSFALNSSANWHRVTYDTNGGGSCNFDVLVILSRARVMPVDQDSRTTVYSDVI